jgi:raffinose/stachyose/melibiose transport system substrate-binding protein
MALVAIGAMVLAACAPGGTAAPRSSSSPLTSAAQGGGSGEASAGGTSSGSGAPSAGSGGSTPAGGATVTADPATLGTLTLTVWDQETTPGISDSLDQLNKEFHAKYPNITVNRVVRSGTDLRTTLKLALSGNNPPDVIQANQGFADMAAYVKAGLLVDLGPYEKAYGWDQRIPSSQRALDSVTPDGSKLGAGNLYGLSITGEVVGVFYNKSILKKVGLPVPTSVTELEAQLPKIKAAGVLPISYGDQNKSPGIHLWSITLVPAVGYQAISDLVFGRSGSWTNPAVESSAQTLADWVGKGYLTQGYDGINSNSAAEAFGKGQAAYFLGGVWNQDAIQKGLGEGAGFTVLPGDKGGPLVAMGGVGMGWAIPSKSSHQKAAAAYIDFISSTHAMDVLQQHNQLPAVPDSSAAATPGTLTGDVLTTWSKLTQANGLVPYIDWSTPTFYNTISDNLQSLMAGRQSAAAFGSALQSDYAGFYHQ